MRHAGTILGTIWLSGCVGPMRSPEAHLGHGHGDIETYMARLESPGRAKWQQPEEVLDALALREGEVVADIGAGTGYFAIPIARRVGPTGRVYAVDIEPRMVEHTLGRAEAEGLGQVSGVVCDADDSKLADVSVDTVLMVNTYHHIGDRVAYLRKLSRALRDGGRVVIIDFVPKPRSERGFGPRLAMQLAEETVEGEFRAAGFRLAQAHPPLPEQYFVEYRPAP